MTCEPLVGTTEAAASLGIHPKTLKKWAATKEDFPVLRDGIRLYFRISALEEWINKQLHSQCRSAPPRRNQ